MVTTLYENVKAYVQSCVDCQQNKASNQKPAVWSQFLHVFKQWWWHVIVDFVHESPKTLLENH